MANNKGDGSIILSTAVDMSGIEEGVSEIKKSIKSSAKSVTVAVTAIGTALAYVTKMGVSAYADYEQQVGGIETLFKDSADKVVQYAHDAYKSVGISANEYMRNVTSFSASLLQGLAGDTDKAADIANMALIDMADNANKMGTSMESIQNAYQGFAKQTYTMLDNLKLGYGGTKSEMERLLKRAEQLTGIEYDISNLADVYQAIHVIQQELGITGTTAEEAEETISGSANAMKAAWENVLTAISGGGDIDKAIDDLAEMVATYFENIVPVIEKALAGVGAVIEKIAPQLVQTVAKAFIEAIPQLISAVVQMVKGMAKGIVQAIDELLSSATKSTESIKEDVEDTVDAQDKLTDSIKSTNEELEKSLAGFDDLQILSSSVADDSGSDLLESITGGSTESVSGNALSDKVEMLNEEMARKIGTAGHLLMALGCILMLAGQFGFGIALVVAGAAAAEYAEVQLGGTSSFADLLDTISNAIIITGVLAILLGILLCQAQLWKYGIGMIAVGAASVATAVAVNWDSIKEKIQGSFGGWLAITGIAAIILGILLCHTPLMPLGIGLIAVGAVSLVTTVAVNWDSISETILGIFQKWGGIIAAAGAALIVLGIILCCTGAGVGLGIGLIVAGAAAVTGAVAVNWDAIVEWVANAWNAVKQYWNTHIAVVFTAQWWKNLGSQCVEGFKNAFNGLKQFFANIVNFFIDALNKISFDMPDWLGGGHFGFDLDRVTWGSEEISSSLSGALSGVAGGTVTPSGTESYSWSKDPLSSTVTSAIDEAMRKYAQSSGTQKVVLEIDGREFGRVVIDQGGRESRRIGTSLAVN